MRTSDRTYRQFLAFDDPDKKSDLHDHACLYLTQPEKLTKLRGIFFPDAEVRARIEKVEPRERKSPDIGGDGFWHKWEPIANSFKLKQRYEVSQPITKRSYNGQSTIAGYIDVSVLWVAECQERYELLRRKFGLGFNEAEWAAEENYVHPVTERFDLYIEVKAGRCSVANALQQIETYRVLLGTEGSDKGQAFVLATLFPLSQAELRTLENQHVKHIYISPDDVQQFAAQQSETPGGNF